MDLTSLWVATLEAGGEESPDRMILVARLHPKIRFAGREECWEWQAATNRAGYGSFSTGKSLLGETLAHRVMFSLLVGPVPEGKTLDHECSNPGCVRPDHLEVVSRKENARRAHARRFNGGHPDACVNGHPFTPENRVDNGRWTRCRICMIEQKIQRDRARGRRRASRHFTPATCPNGHPYILENRLKHGTGTRCRLCRNESERARRREKEQAT